MTWIYAEITNKQFKKVIAKLGDTYASTTIDYRDEKHDYSDGADDIGLSTKVNLMII